jgi:hypothetical protein
VVRGLCTVAARAHGSESENHEAPVLNMTSVGKCCCKKLLEKNAGFRYFQILGSWMWDLTPYLREGAVIKTRNLKNFDRR